MKICFMLRNFLRQYRIYVNTFYFSGEETYVVTCMLILIDLTYTGK